MANAWTGHFEKEALSHKMMYEQVSQEYRQYEQRWNSLKLDTAHWTEIAEVIRWANALAKQSYSSGYSYVVNMMEHLKSGNPFTARKRMESFATANKGMVNWTKAAVAQWDKLAAEHGVTLIDYEKDDTEIALMADAALVDIHKYVGNKWDMTEAEQLVKKVKEKFHVSDQEYEAWKLVRKID